MNSSQKTSPKTLNWQTTRLLDITRHHAGNSKLIKGKLSDVPANGLFPAYSASGQDVWREGFEHEGEAIIVSAVGARCGKCFLASGKWSAIANTHVVWPNPEVIDRKFLWYRINDENFWERSGSAQPFVVVRKTFERPFALPPLDVQREIVAEIEKQFTRLEAGVAGLRRVQANLKLYRAAVLKAACEGKLVPTEACLRQAERGRQAELARQDGRALPAPRPGVFYVYAIRCDNDSIYLGQTQDLQKRWKDHLAGQAADWTGQHKPMSIVHYEEYGSREEAVAREKWLKTGFGRKWLRREIAAGRARQAGYETGAQLLERILAERRQKWNGKGKYKEPAKPNTSNLPPVPDGWAWARLEQLSFVFGGLTKNPKRAKLGSQLPYLRVANVYANELRLDDVQQIGVDDSELEKLLLRRDDLLVVEGNGSKDQIGRVAIWDGSIDPCVHQNHVIKVRPIRSSPNFPVKA